MSRLSAKLAIALAAIGLLLVADGVRRCWRTWDVVAEDVWKDEPAPEGELSDKE